MKMNSKLEFGHQKFVMDCAKANIGAMRSYKMMKTVDGSYSSIGCSRMQVKNFSRDLKAYVFYADAQMVIDKLHRKCELCSGFYFEVEVDENDHLKSLFWADPIARRNFCAFGDVVSFDATYNTNKYNMIFAPFTTKDNHRKCIMLAAALMTEESIESYAWVFEAFKKCMLHEPDILITDQDPAIKVAFKHVFQHTRHRLFNVEPDVFEVKWREIMNTFDMVEESWFISMYNIREMWIPAYFRDLKIGSLFRTTSPSENSQRHDQAKLNNQDLSCRPDFRTMLPFEKHAAMVCLHEVDDCVNGIATVKYDRVGKDIVCSCKRFVMSCAAIEENRFTLYDIISKFYSCLSMADGDLDMSNSLLQAIRDVKCSFKSGGDVDNNLNGKKRFFEEYYQSSLLEQVIIKSPEPVKIKGSGSRLKSNREKNVEKMSKPTRKCRACGEKGHHDSKNCLGKKKI
ncbi:hypothetical protein C2S51_030169 [Perilla frutescens var. frutescens]|nr:hypothetical protein C2S51_030169 [Perilla frutescens var. frutescens]